MNDIKRFSLVKPTVETPFHIDFAWWKNHDSNWRVYLFSYLCPEHQAAFEKSPSDIMVDFIDPETAEIHQFDGLQHVLMTHCVQQADFLTSTSSIVDLVFRILLARGNTPITPRDLSVEVNRPAETILRTLSGSQVYKGIRPCQS